MYRQTLAQIKNISMYLPDPNRAEKAMHNLLSCSVKLCKKVLTKDLISRMFRCGMTTKDIDSFVPKFCRSKHNNNKRIHNLKRILMKDKLEDTEYELRLARRELG